MGTDIHGWVEAHLTPGDDPDDWLAVVDAGAILDRDYAAFARLFGVRASGEVKPVAAGRGLPADASYAVRDDTAPVLKGERYLDGFICCHSASWLSWSEVQALKRYKPSTGRSSGRTGGRCSGSCGCCRSSATTPTCGWWSGSTTERRGSREQARARRSVE